MLLKPEKEQAGAIFRLIASAHLVQAQNKGLTVWPRLAIFAGEDFCLDVSCNCGSGDQRIHKRRAESVHLPRLAPQEGPPCVALVDVRPPMKPPPRSAEELLKAFAFSLNFVASRDESTHLLPIRSFLLYARRPSISETPTVQARFGLGKKLTPTRNDDGFSIAQVNIS